MRTKHITSAEQSVILDSVLPNTIRIDKAPSYFQLIAGVSSEEHEDRIMMAEEVKDYKGSDSYGNVFLMKNPALMTWQMARGISPVDRHKPRLYEEGQSTKQIGAPSRNMWRASSKPPIDLDALTAEKALEKIQEISSRCINAARAGDIGATEQRTRIHRELRISTFPKFHEALKIHITAIAHDHPDNREDFVRWWNDYGKPAQGIVPFGKVQKLVKDLTNQF